MAVIVALLCVLEIASSLKREVRATIAQQQGDTAFYVADAGFNRVRASLIDKSLKVGTTNICPSSTIVGTLIAQDGTLIGTYRVTTTCGSACPNSGSSSAYTVVSQGWLGTVGQESVNAKGEVRGQLTCQNKGSYSAVNTTYLP